jgi:hypothetical protein
MSYLDIKYINLMSPRLDRFGWKKRNLAACRCPICGDSKKNKNKTRFFFYEKKGGYFVKCHNCDYGTTLGKFIEHIDPFMYKEYALEKYRDGTTGRHEERTPEEIIPKTRVPRKRLVALPSVKVMAENEPDHLVVDFVRRRMIPVETWDRIYYAEDFSEFTNGIDPSVVVSSDERLVMPMITDGILEGATGRLLSGEGLRYIMVKRNPDQQRMWFGLDRVDPDETVYITEGSLDSLFLPNAIAMNGLGNVELPDGITDPVFVLDNEPRNKELVRTLYRLVQANHRVCIYPPSVGQKDLNEMVLSGTTLDGLKRMVDENTVSGMEARLRLTAWSKC